MEKLKSFKVGWRAERGGRDVPRIGAHDGSARKTGSQVCFLMAANVAINKKAKQKNKTKHKPCGFLFECIDKIMVQVCYLHQAVWLSVLLVNNSRPTHRAAA